DHPALSRLPTRRSSDLSDLPPLALHLDRATAAFDMAPSSGYLEDTVATGAGGEVHLSAALNLDPLSFDLAVAIARPLELAPYLRSEERRVGQEWMSRLS